MRYLLLLVLLLISKMSFAGSFVVNNQFSVDEVTKTVGSGWSQSTRVDLHIKTQVPVVVLVQQSNDPDLARLVPAGFDGIIYTNLLDWQVVRIVSGASLYNIPRN